MLQWSAAVGEIDLCYLDESGFCLWMPVEDYLSHESVHQFNRRVVRAVLTGGGIVPEGIDGYGTPETHEFFMPPGTP